MPASTPASTALAEALALHRQGRMKDAEIRYGQILAKEPDNLVARYRLGRLQRGNLQGGLSSRRASRTTWGRPFAACGGAWCKRQNG